MFQRRMMIVLKMVSGFVFVRFKLYMLLVMLDKLKHQGIFDSSNHDEYCLLLLQYDGENYAVQIIVKVENDNAFLTRHHVDWDTFNYNLFFNTNRLR